MLQFMMTPTTQDVIMIRIMININDPKFNLHNLHWGDHPYTNPPNQKQGPGGVNSIWNFHLDPWGFMIQFDGSHIFQMSNEKRAPGWLDYIYIWDDKLPSYISGLFHKPWNKDPVINQPGFQWKVRPGIFRGSNGVKPSNFLTSSILQVWALWIRCWSRDGQDAAVLMDEKR